MDHPAEVRFNGEEILHGVFQRFKVWLHEVCRSPVNVLLLLLLI